MEAEQLFFYIDTLIVPFVVLILALLGFILILRGKIGKLEIGRFAKLSGVGVQAEEIRARLSSAASHGDGKASQQYALLKEYHAQGLPLYLYTSNGDTSGPQYK